MKNKYLLQHDSRDCGATCLAMIAAHYNKNLSIARARVYTKTDKSGCNLYGLVDCASAISLNAEALSGTMDELMDSLQKGEIRLPMIAHIVSDQQLLHFVVVYNVNRKGFIIGDPGKGKVKMTFEEFANVWTGHVVSFQKADDFKEDKKPANKLVQMFKLIDLKDARIGITVLLSMIVAGIGVAGSFIFKLILDNEYVDNNYYRIPEIFLSIIVLYFMQALIEILRGKIILSTSKNIDITLSMKYYSHLINMPVFELGKWQTGEYLSRLSDVSMIRSALASGLVSVILDVSMVLVCAVMLVRLNWVMFLVSLLIVILYLILTMSTKKPLERLNREAFGKSAVFQSFFKESVDGIQTVKMTNADSFIKEGEEKFVEFAEADRKNSYLGIKQDSLATLIELVGTVVILWIGFIFTQKSAMSTGDLITFYALLGYFISPCKSLSQLQPSVQAALIAMDRLEDMMEVDTEECNKGRAIAADTKEWELKDIDFRYGNRELTLKKINLHVKKGERIALVGESGSGKTSIAKLLMKFYNPESGEILIDGESLSEYSTKSVRDSISYIGQDSYLFSKTIKENLTLYDDSIGDDEIEEVCRKCRISDFADDMPLGLDTPVDENGMNLSSGQRQRIVIGRALLRHPQLLIMDEATSNLDQVTEQGITQTINEIGGDTACVIIAHRLSTIEKCDRIYVLKKGEIVEVGTHEELLRNGKEYCRLLNNQ